jgi:hypothetical protein
VTPPEAPLTITAVIRDEGSSLIRLAGSVEGDCCAWPRLAPLEVAAVVGPSPSTRAERPSWSPQDIVDEWGVQSFPASDPPANW